MSYNVGKKLEILDLSLNFLDNINMTNENNNEEIAQNVLKNSTLKPAFRYYKDDVNLTPKFLPPYVYKNKNLYPPEKPIQTENDEIGQDIPKLNMYYKPINYGNYYVQNVNLPEKNKHHISYNHQLFELLSI